jgi:phage terminase large subunit-like protein
VNGAAPDDPTTQYARDVCGGRVVAGRLVRLACERHLRDLEEGPARGLEWDAGAAAHAMEFFGCLSLAEGEHEARPFLLEPPQQFIVGCLFGWKGEDGYRRFRTAYVEMGKGNGKSPLAGGLGLYGLTGDGEAAAEVYSAATTREQAGILFRDAKNMVKASPMLREALDVGQANIAFGTSFFRPVSSEHRGLDGKRVHVALIDELHEHPTALVVDKMRAGTKGRRQALIFEITNSGHDRTSVCWRHHEYSVQVLKGKVQNDSWFAYVCGLDPCERHAAEGKDQPAAGCPDCDDWRDERAWPKANPLLGVSVTRKYLREQVAEAEGMPAKQGLVKRLNFCWWTEGETAWLPDELWSRGAGPLDVAGLAGRACCGGLDLASTTDLTAWVLCFPDWPEPGHFTLLPRFWIPKETALEREYKDGVPYRLWDEQGHITLTEGNAVDQDLIEEKVKEDFAAYALGKVGFDPWNSAQITTHLMAEGVEVESFQQSAEKFNEPTKLFESLLRDGKLHHGGHPVLSWCAGNVSVVTTRSGMVRPVKPAHSSPKKVDGVVAAVMALGKAMLAPAAEESSVEVW